jgi:hypothetical protein
MLAARRIKFKAERTKQDLLDIGKELTEAKARLSHGQFGEWLAIEFDMSERSAQRFMSVYQTYGAKSDTVSLLSDTALYLLSGPTVPDEAREQVEVEARTTGRSPTKARVQEIIAAHKPPPSPRRGELHSPLPLAAQTLATLATPAEEDEEGPGHTGDTSRSQTGDAGAIDSQGDDEQRQPDLVDLVTMEAHIWRVALLEVGHDLTKLHQWITEHDQPDPYGRIACARPHTFAEAYAVVSHEIATKYDYGSHPLPLPPDEEEPHNQQTSAIELHNSHINQISIVLSRIQQINLDQYSAITGDRTSPRKLRDITSVMIHKLKGNLR